MASSGCSPPEGGRSTWWGVRMELSWVSSSPLLIRALGWMIWSTSIAYLQDHGILGTQTSSILCCDVSPSNGLIITGSSDHALVYQITY